MYICMQMILHKWHIFRTFFLKTVMLLLWSWHLGCTFSMRIYNAFVMTDPKWEMAFPTEEPGFSNMVNLFQNKQNLLKWRGNILTSHAFKHGISWLNEGGENCQLLAFLCVKTRRSSRWNVNKLSPSRRASLVSDRMHYCHAFTNPAEAYPNKNMVTSRCPQAE